MTDDELKRAYAALRRQRQARVASPAPLPEQLQGLVSGTLSQEERESLLEQTLESGAVDELALLHSAARSDFAERSSAARSGNLSMTNWRRFWPVSAAAAAVLVVAVGAPRLRLGTAVLAPIEYRAENGAAGPRLLNPAVDAFASNGQRFVWNALPDAAHYQLELVDANGRAVISLRTTDTTVSLPDTLPVSRLATAEGWWVVASSTGGVQWRSELRLFRERASR